VGKGEVGGPLRTSGSFRLLPGGLGDPTGRAPAGGPWSGDRHPGWLCPPHRAAARGTADTGLPVIRRKAVVHTPTPNLLDTIYACQQRQEWYRDYAQANGGEPVELVGASGRLGRPSTTKGAAAQFLAAGDYFLVSQALSLGHTVVTREEPAPFGKKRIKIPDACNAVRVAWMADAVGTRALASTPRVPKGPEVPGV